MKDPKENIIYSNLKQRMITKERLACNLTDGYGMLAHLI